MSIIELTQEEADTLLSMEKHVIDSSIYNFPQIGDKLDIELVSPDKREKFILDISRGNLNVKKITYQNRAKKAIVLIILDIEGPPHRNPDDTEIPCPHIHIYREGYGVKWAFQINKQKFTNTADMMKTLDEFMEYCNITKKPLIQTGLF